MKEPTMKQGFYKLFWNIYKLEPTYTIVLKHLQMQPDNIILVSLVLQLINNEDDRHYKQW